MTTAFTNPLIPAEVFKLTLPSTATVNENGEVVADLSGASAVYPTFADNAAALAGGLVVNDLYKTATGEVRIVV